jgi:flavodoxin
MRIVIVYDSHTGTTKAAAEAMAQMATDAGHDSTAVPVQAASPADAAAADALCVGSWTEGLFFIRQHATQATMQFIDGLSLEGTPALVFCTYKTTPGKMLQKMAEALEARGGRVTAQLRSRGPYAAEGFGNWLESLSRA